MLNRVKGAPPFKRRDGSKRDLVSLPSNDVKRDVLFQVGRAPTPVDAGQERRFASYKKISFHHTAKTRRRQPRAGRNNATFLAKILAFSTKPSVSVVFSPQIELRRLNRRRFAGTSADKKNKQGRPFCVFVQIRGEIGRRSTRSPPTF